MKKIPKWVIVTIIGFSLAVFLAGWEYVKTEYISRIGVEEKTIYSRGRFENLVHLKSSEEVIKLIGRPKWTTTGKPYLEDSWCYEKITYDTISEKVDLLTFITFESNMVTGVGY